jgi:hypothetical protein
MLAAAPATAEDLGTYREFSLGSSVQTVVGLTGAHLSDLKTVHQRPAVLQELTWRPRYSAGRTLPDVDPVREMVFDFHDDRLYRITVYYDRARTAGLTSEDLIGALRGEYGSPLPGFARTEGPRSIPSESATAVAEWARDGTRCVIWMSRGVAGWMLNKPGSN